MAGHRSWPALATAPAIDPRMLVTVTGNETLAPIVDEVAEKVNRAVAKLA